MATIKDIAARSGLSIATVSKRINGIPVSEESRRRIDEAIEALGYQVNAAARTLKTRRSMTIGILLDSLANLFYTAVISEAEELLLQRGYTALLFETKDSPEREEQGLALFRAKSVDGVLYFSSHSSPALIRSCLKLKLPIVTVDSIAAGTPEADFVVTDNAAAASGAVGLLLEKGHREIGVITGGEGHFSAGERLRGCREALSRAGRPLREEWTLRDAYTIDGGYRCANRLLALPARPTALVICNYFMALGTVMALNEQNVRVPDELSLLSFDDFEWINALRPRLTTVSQQAARIAGEAVGCLLARIGGSTEPGKVLLIPTALTERDSILPRPIL